MFFVSQNVIGIYAFIPACVVNFFSDRLMQSIPYVQNRCDASSKQI